MKVPHRHIRLFVNVGTTVPVCQATRRTWDKVAHNGAATTTSLALADCPICRQLFLQRRTLFQANPQVR